MRIRFWGTRGSLPVSLTAAEVRAKLVTRAARRVGPQRSRRTASSTPTSTASGSPWPEPTAATRPASRSRPAARTTCCATSAAALRPFGQAAIARHGPARRRPTTSSCPTCTGTTSWGCPFFAPAYIPGNRIRFYGGHAGLEEALRRQQDAPSFPGGLLDAARGHRVHAPRARQALRHRRHDRDGQAPAPRGRLLRLPLRGGRAAASSTRPIPSTSSRPGRTTEGFVEFFRDADVVIFDAMYSLAEATSVKADWGHSSNIVGVELCQLAGRAAAVPVPPRAGATTTRPSAACSPKRAASRRSRAPAHRCASRPPTTGWKSSCEPGARHGRPPRAGSAASASRQSRS